MEEALDYDSTDSFGLPKAKPKAKPSGRKQDLDPTAHNGSETSKAPADAGSSSARTGPSVTSDGGKPDEIPSSRRSTSAAASSDLLSRDSMTSTSLFEGRPGPTRDGAAAPKAGSGQKIDLDDDFDSPDDDLNELLEMTDPSALAKARTSASASTPALVSKPASATIPPLLLPPAGSTDPPRDYRNMPREQTSDSGSASPVRGRAITEGNTTPGDAARPRSPSPPSSPREDHRSGHSLRSRLGRGMAYSGSRDSLKTGGGGPEEHGEGGQGGRSGLTVEPAATNTAAEGINISNVSTARSSMHSLTSNAGSRGVRGDVLPEEGEAGRGVRDEALEQSPQSHVSGREASAAAGSGGTTNREGASSLRGNGEREGTDDATRLLTSSGQGVASRASSRAPRRSALAGADKSKSHVRPAKSRGVTFDDDLAGVDALDILPGSSSDEGEKHRGTAAPIKTAELLTNFPPSEVAISHHDSAKSAYFSTSKPPGVAGKPSVAPLVSDGGRGGGEIARVLPRAATPSDAVKRRSSSSAAMTEGLSPAAARVMAEDSSSEESHAPQASEASAMGSLLGLEDPRPGKSAGGHPQEGTQAGSLFGQGPRDAGEREGMATTDEAKLDLALGFTPSSMDGARKPRRTLPAGRRRRQRGGTSPTTADGAESKQAKFASLASTLPEPIDKPNLSANMATSLLEDTSCGRAGIEDAAAAAGVVVSGAAKDAEETGNGLSSHIPGELSASGAPVAAASHLATSPPAGIAVSAADASTEPSASPAPSSAGASSSAALPPNSNSSLQGTSTASHGGGIPSPFNAGSRHGSRGNASALAASSRAENTDQSRGVDTSAFASLERQLVILAGEKEAMAERSARDEQRMQKDSDLVRDMAATAQARAFELEAALAVARFVRREGRERKHVPPLMHKSYQLEF